MPDDANKVAGSSLLQPAKVRFRRLMQEGFRGFLVTLFLFSTGVTLATIYFHEKADLDEAVRNETIKMVGTRQEPTDAVNELGLIATALAKVNDPFAPRASTCSEPGCIPDEELPERLVRPVLAKVIQAASTHLDIDGDWTGTTGEIANLTQYKQNPENLSWPELGPWPVCSLSGDQTFLQIPSPMRGLHEPHFSARVAAAADISKNFFFDTLHEFLQKYHSDASRVVQIYFISPDSLLRIWTSRQTDVCGEFPKARFWASKNYFSQFWDGDPTENHSTLAYIDYGGNGLVRTSCHAIELPSNIPGHNRALADYPRGHFMGILCMDFKLSDKQVALMKRQLFFETADVNFPVRGTHDLQDIVVKLVPPEFKTEAQEPVRTPQPPSTAKTTTQPVGAAAAGADPTSSAAAARPTSVAKDEAVLHAAIVMQASTLDPAKVQERLYEDLKNVDTHKLLREITRVTYMGKPAFLLPLGESNGSFHGLFFFPRSPVLPFWVTFIGFLGVLCGGASSAAFFYNWRSQTKITELRKRISLFRNLQVGVVQVDPSDYIVECNDRAEELVGRKLPKPGVGLEAPLNFQQLFPFRVRLQHGRYEPITSDEINGLRKSGKASSYWACLSMDYGPDGPGNGGRPKWLFVRATPIMEPQTVRYHSEPRMEPAGAEARRNARQMRLYGVFATISEAFPERIPHLDAMLKLHCAAKEDK